METANETFKISAAAAELYESQFVPALFAEWAPRLTGLAGVAPGQARRCSTWRAGRASSHAR
jgi:hypothetical protein